MGSKGWWLIIILILAVGAYFVFAPGNTSQNGDSQPVSVEKEFETKVVYTQNVDQDPAPFQADCELRGGEFNECGSICSPDADMCAQVCAYTCDNINHEESVIGSGDGATTTDATSSMPESATGTSPQS